MFRSAITRSAIAHARPFHTTRPALKSVTEKVSEVADNVNKGLGKRLASAIESGEQAAAKTKETIESATGQGKKKMGEAAKVASQKKNEAEAGAREAKDDLAQGAREAKDDLGHKL